MNEQISIAVVGICILSMCCQLLAWRTRVPSILYLLLCGVLVGPIGGYLNPDQLFGDLLFPMVSLAVAVILFEGSLTLNFAKIAEQKHHILKFIVLGSIITFLGISVTAYRIFDSSVSIALLIGAILTVTGPTVITPMLRTIRPTINVCNVSKWEGIILDPFGAILTVLVFDFIIRGHSDDLVMHGTVSFVKMVCTGAMIGFIFGMLLSEVLERHLIPKFLINLTVLSFVLSSFVVANLFFHETGLLAVTIMGLTLANRPNIDLHEILEFKETISTLLLSSLFIVLAARIDLVSLSPVLLPSLMLFAVMQFVIRPTKVLLTTTNSGMSAAEKVTLTWIAPRGIIAAAIASLFEYKLLAQGYDVAFISPTVFLIIVWSVLLPSLTGRFIAQKTGACQPEPNGTLIIGANPLSRKLAEILMQHQREVLIADNNWEEISLARMRGIKTFYGNPLSENAADDLELNGIGKLLVMTPNTDLGALASLHFRRDLERKNIYYLPTEYEQSSSHKHTISKEHRGRALFAHDACYEQLLEMLITDYEIKSTLLSEQFTYEDYLAMQAGHCIPLLAFDGKDNMHLFSPETEVKPNAGWTVISLMKNHKP